MTSTLFPLGSGCAEWRVRPSARPHVEPSKKTASQLESNAHLAAHVNRDLKSLIICASSDYFLITYPPVEETISEASQEFGSTQTSLYLWMVAVSGDAKQTMAAAADRARGFIVEQ